MVSRSSLLVMMVAVAACFPSRALREGDAAATRGEWRSAERAYRRAVSEKPGDQTIATKYTDAKARAIVEAIGVAEACGASADLLCVERELAYVLEIDPTNVEAATRRVQARKGLSLRELTAARTANEAGDPLAAWSHIDKARQLGLAEEYRDELNNLDRDNTLLAVNATQALLRTAASQRVDEAVKTLTQAERLASGVAERDATHKQLIVQVRQARTEVIDRAHASLIATADERVVHEDYAGAADALEQANRLQVNRLIVTRARFARSMANGIHATRRRSFDAAARAFEEALATGVDPAKSQEALDRVTPRVYRVRIDSIAIQPYRPGTGQPWVGTPWWKAAAPAIAAVVVSATPVGAPFAGAASEITEAVVNSIPDENRPKLALEIELPDGRLLRTVKARKGLYAVFDAEFYVRTNMLDARTIRLHVVHERSSGDEDVAVVNVPLGPIIAGTVDATALTGSGDALRGVLFSTDQAPEEMDGIYSGLVPMDIAENRASTRSSPVRGHTWMHLDRVDLTWLDGADGWGSAEPYIKVTQAGQEVIKTAVGRPGEASWSFARTGLFVSESEALEVRLMEADAADDDTVATWTVPGSMILQRTVSLTTPKGSHVELHFRPRVDRPR